MLRGTANVIKGQVLQSLVHQGVEVVMEGS